MITDNGLRLATAEALNLQNAGVLTVPVIGADSATLALDESGLTDAHRIFRDVGRGEPMALAINVDTTVITAAGHDSTVEIQLISMPVPAAATHMDAATTEGFLHGMVNAGGELDTDVTGGVAEDIIKLTAHGLPLGTPVWFSVVTTTTVILVDRVYYVIPIDADNFQVATTLANAIAGTQVQFGTGDGSVHIEWIPTIHASTGSLRLFDEIGAAVHGGMLVAGHQFAVPLQPKTARTSKQALPAGQTLTQGLSSQRVAQGEFSEASLMVMWVSENFLKSRRPSFAMTVSLTGGVELTAPPS